MGYTITTTGVRDSLHLRGNRDGMGFDLIKNPNGQGVMVAPQSEVAWREWTLQNPPPNDGHSYESSPLYPQWRRVD